MEGGWTPSGRFEGSGQIFGRRLEACGAGPGPATRTEMRADDIDTTSVANFLTTYAVPLLGPVFQTPRAGTIGAPCRQADYHVWSMCAFGERFDVEPTVVP